MADARNLNETFIRDVDLEADPFSEIGERSGVDNPTRMLEGWTGWAARGRELQPDVSTDDVRFEAAVGRFLTNPAALLQILSSRRRAVALISADGTNHKGDTARWTGTGFVVGPNLLLTNHHVLNTIEVARGARIEFDFEISIENLLLGAGQPLPTSQVFKLDPSRLFLTSPTIGGLDYTFVWIEEAAAQKFGTIPLERSSFTVNKRDQAFIVHHPDGQHKQVSLDDTDIVAIEATVIHYASDTLEGSSGAPVFDRRGRLIALHHASREMKITLPDGGETDRVNEGIKISAIALELENRARAGGADAAFAETVLREIKGSDTMSGFFGASGRAIQTQMGRVGPEAAVGPAAVVATYRGTDQDIDVGFWNLEGLASRWQQPGALDGTAKVIADLNLDLWGLLEVSPAAVAALVQKLNGTYGERYAWAFSEPDPLADQQGAAMIWKQSSLEGGKIDWPSAVEPLFRRQGDDAKPPAGAALPGRIFERYPAVYRFRTPKGAPPYSFCAVPLYLKAGDDGSIRRRLATRILARAVEDLAKQSGADVILGGFMNTPLARDDFAAIEDDGFAILGAQDESAGVFSYIKSPDSPIDNVFLSPSMRQTVGKMDYFVVARDRQMPDYLAISDHRPVAVRMSLAAGPLGERSLGRRDLDAMIEQMLAPAGKERPRGRRKTRAPAQKERRAKKR